MPRKEVITINTKLYTDIGQFDMIAGDTKVFPFEVVADDGSLVILDAENAGVDFYLSPFDDLSTTVLALTIGHGITLDEVKRHQFDVKLSAEMTKDLNGLYEFQVEITSPVGDLYRPICGHLSIFPQNT